MASPISATMPLNRCWTTERVTGSTEAGIGTVSSTTNEAGQSASTFFFFTGLTAFVAGFSLAGLLAANSSAAFLIERA